MSENEIITQQDPQMQMFAQLMEGVLKKLERYCATARPMLGGETYLTRDCCTYYLSDLLYISLIISIFVSCLKAF